MSSITLGQVAGLIAAGVFLVRAIIPLALVVILASILQPETNAVTWSVASRALQASLWPTLLSSDSESTKNVSRRVVLLSWLILLASVLLNVAGIVTPLGLSQASLPAASVHARFAYAPDVSSFGRGTPPRYPSFSRVCGLFLLSDCPGRADGWTTGSNNSFSAIEQPGVDNPYINSTLPESLTEIFTSATGQPGNTLTGALDIQYRTWSMMRDDGTRQTVDRGQPYPIGKFRPLGNVILRNGIVILEGLVVDAANGGIGFRNHSVPLGYERGARWQEDLTWIQPVTTCVSTNLTIEYKTGYSEDVDLEDASIIDNGGFVDMQIDYPEAPLASQDVDLHLVARKGALLFTNYAMQTVKAQRNLSSIGKSWPLPLNDIGKTYGRLPDALQLSKITGVAVNAPYTVRNNSLPGSDTYIVTESDFRGINTVCELSGGGDVNSISNVLIKCGIILAPPRPADAQSNPLVFQPNATYLREVHVCASSMRASIKTVTFEINGTAALANLRVERIEDKRYESPASLPVWAMERLQKNISEIQPLWGMVHERYEKHPDLQTLRHEHFWLPNILPATATSTTQDALAVAGAFGSAMVRAYSVDPFDSTSGLASIYSGSSDFGLYAMWQKLAATPGSASRTVNLITTDILASYVVGTKSAIMAADLQKANDASNVLALIDVFESRIEYNMLYAIPAVIALVGMLLAVLVALFFSVTRKFTIARLRQYLNQATPGRLFTDLVHAELCPKGASTKIWNKVVGTMMLTPLPQDEVQEGVEMRDSASIAVSLAGYVEHREAPNDSQQRLSAHVYGPDHLTDSSNRLNQPS